MALNSDSLKVNLSIQASPKSARRKSSARASNGHSKMTVAVINMDSGNADMATKFTDTKKMSVSSTGKASSRQSKNGATRTEQDRKNSGLTALGAARDSASKAVARADILAPAGSGNGSKFGASGRAGSSSADFSAFFSGESADDDFISELAPKTTTISAGSLRGFKFRPKGIKYGDKVAKNNDKKEIRKQKMVNKHVERRRRARGGGGLVKSGGKSTFPGELSSGRSTDINDSPGLTSGNASTAQRSLTVQSGIKLSPRSQILASAFGTTGNQQETGVSLQQAQSADGDRDVLNSRLSTARVMNGTPSASLSTTKTVQENN